MRSNNNNNKAIHICNLRILVFLDDDGTGKYSYTYLKLSDINVPNSEIMLTNL